MVKFLMAALFCLMAGEYAQAQVSAGSTARPLQRTQDHSVSSRAAVIEWPNSTFEMRGATGVVSFSGSALGGGSSEYIQNRSTLQSGATFFVSSGTVGNIRLADGCILFPDNTIQCSSPTGTIVTAIGLPLPENATNYLARYSTGTFYSISNSSLSVSQILSQGNTGKKGPFILISTDTQKLFEVGGTSVVIGAARVEIGEASELFTTNGKVGVGLSVFAPTATLDVQTFDFVAVKAGFDNPVYLMAPSALGFNLFEDFDGWRSGQFSSNEYGLAVRQNPATGKVSFLFSPPADDGEFVTPVEKLTITKDGFVGISTDIPRALLHVSSTTTAPLLFLISTGTTRIMEVNSSSTVIHAGSTTVTINETDTAFKIDNPGKSGIGKALDVFSGTFTVLKNGFVGVGTAAPVVPLDVVTTSGSVLAAFGVKNPLYITNTLNLPSVLYNLYYDNTFRLGRNSVGAYGAITQWDAVNGTYSLGISTSGGNAGQAIDVDTMFSIDSAGDVYIGGGSTNYKLRVDGSLFINSSNTDKLSNIVWTNPSDAALKNVIGDYTSGLAKLKQLRPVRYTLKPDNPFGASATEEHIGFVAQDVQPVLPEAISMGADGYLRFTGDAVLWTHLNATKELAIQVEELQGTVNGLQNLICGEILFSGSPFCQ